MKKIQIDDILKVFWPRISMIFIIIAAIIDIKFNEKLELFYLCAGLCGFGYIIVDIITQKLIKRDAIQIECKIKSIKYRYRVSYVIEYEFERDLYINEIYAGKLLPIMSNNQIKNLKIGDIFNIYISKKYPKLITVKLQNNLLNNFVIVLCSIILIYFSGVFQ